MSRFPLAIVAAFCFLLALQAGPAAADEAASIYQPGTVAAIDLTLEPAAIASLEAEPDEYVAGTFSFAPDATPGGGGTFTAPRKVEVRLKGHASFRPIEDGKSAFKLKFKKTEAFLGLRKLTLNNMVQDPSMVRETLSFAAFRATGVPAPRTGFANLRVNGENFGVYLNLETLDDIAMKNLFGSFDPLTQHLYEGELGEDVRPGDAGKFEADEGDEANRADLEALIAAVASAGPEPWSERVAANADLGEMTRMWAVEHYIGHWDSYSGGQEIYQPSNYYLYSDPTGRFQMLPWGTDGTWLAGEHLAFDVGNGLLFTHCLADQSCEATYRESLATACEAIAGAGIDQLASSTAALLSPWQEAEQANSRHEHSLAEVEEGVAETREYIASRPAEAGAWLGGPCGPVAGDTPGSPTDGEATSTPVTSMPPTTAPDSPRPVSVGEPPRIEVGRSKLVGTALVTHLDLISPAAVIQKAWITTKAGPLIACRAKAMVKRPRELALSCPLNAVALEHLEARWLRVYLETKFDRPSGSDRAVSSVTVSRLGAY